MSDEASLFTLGEVRREREVPFDLEAALHQTAPQALLRDLHRPVRRFEIAPHDFEQVQMIRVDAGAAELRDLRRTLLASYRAPLELFPWAGREMYETFRSVRALLALPWQDAPKFGPEKISPEAYRVWASL